MNILVVGSGGREHALVWKIAQSALVKKIYCAPGNGGIAGIAECVDINADAVDALADFAEDKRIDLTVVGPEAPLAMGIVDIFNARGLPVFGPTKQASRLEASKVFAKNFMKKYGVPTADFWIFSDSNRALDFVRKANRPLVIKADGLCSGKGVFICYTAHEQEKAVISLLKEDLFGEAGRTIMVEEMLEGEEASIIVISDGDQVIAMASSQDHKRIFDNDRGPNTGGMGAYSPAPVVTEEILERINREVIIPVIQGMNQEHSPYRGVLYAGMMMTLNGPKVLEFNARFGDPETQVILPRLKSDIVEIMLKANAGALESVTLEWDERACVCVVLAAGGYPGAYVKGKQINGLDGLKKKKDIVVFHAGTAIQNGIVRSSGGRVLGVVGLGKGIYAAMSTVYAAVEKVSFEGMYYRTDIGRKALQRDERELSALDG
jgi:phosphoribosylamine--glycine ligase